MKTKTVVASLLALLLAAVGFNVTAGEPWFVSFPDANTRPTYDTFHHLKEAQQLATGKGIKVGIVGKYFGYADHASLYAGGKDFVGDQAAFENAAEHGLWMATTLREVAPDVEIYALNARSKDRGQEREAVIKAIDWAIANDLDILTYSARAFRSADRDAIDKAVRRAVANGIVTTFIHYDLPENILPTGFFPDSPSDYARAADVNVYHFDYNLLLLFKYEKYVDSGRKPTRKVGDLPYFSNSSMSPVLAGIVAMMKEVDNSLPAAEYKRILVETSREIDYDGYQVGHVVDAARAVSYLLEMNARAPAEQGGEP